MTDNDQMMVSVVLSVEWTADTPPVECDHDHTSFSSPQRELCLSPDMPESSLLSQTTHDDDIR